MTNSIYLVLDMINDLVHEDGPNGKAPYGVQARERGILAATALALGKARAAGVPVGYVRVGFSADYREIPASSPIFSRVPAAGIFKLGTWGTQVHPLLAPRAEDFDIVKHRVSPFYSTHLEVILRTQDIRRIYCSGVSTNAVVQATVREGHDRDFEMVVVEDCCAALSALEHAEALATLGRFATFTAAQQMAFP